MFHPQQGLSVSDLWRLGLNNNLNNVCLAMMAAMAVSAKALYLFADMEASVAVLREFGDVFAALILVAAFYFFHFLICLYFGMDYRQRFLRYYGSSVLSTLREWTRGIWQHTSLSDYLRLKHGKTPDEMRRDR